MVLSEAFARTVAIFTLLYVTVPNTIFTLIITEILNLISFLPIESKALLQFTKIKRFATKTQIMKQNDKIEKKKKIKGAFM